MKIFENIEDVKAIRKKTGMNQIDFWGKVGVTQSGGSRYETGRKMPKPVRELLRLIHIECLDLAKVNKKDMEIAALLKKHHPDLYAELSKQTKAERKKQG
ncbi:helix-turn-helix transcriptional regulator [Neisseria gonorrhoeae]